MRFSFIYDLLKIWNRFFFLGLVSVLALITGCGRANDGFQESAEALRDRALEYRDNGDVHRALRFFNEAHAASVAEGNDSLTACILIHWGEMLNGQYPYTEGSRYFAEAGRLALGARDTFVAVNSLVREAYTYISRAEADKADSVYRYAEELAVESADFTMLASIYRQQAYLNYILRNDNRMALDLINKALSLEGHIDNDEDLFRCYTIKALVLIQMDSLYEADVWLDKSSRLISPLQYSDYLKSRALWHEKRGEYKEANVLTNRAWEISDSVFTRQRQDRIIEFQNTITRQGLEIENRHLEARTQRQNTMLLLCAIIFILALFGVYVYTRRIRAIHMEVANTLRMRILEEANRHEGMVSAMRSRLLEQDDTMRRLQAIKDNSGQRKKGLSKFSDEDIRDIRDLLDICYDGFTDRLLAAFPQLTEADIDLLCMVKLNLSNKDISLLMGASVEAVRQRKYRLRNSRISLPDGITIEDYMAGF